MASSKGRTALADDGASLLADTLSQALPIRSVMSLLVALAAHIIFFTSGIHMVKFTYSTSNGGMLDEDAVAGSFMWLAGIIAGPFSVGLALIVLGQSRHRLGRLAGALAASLTICCFALMVWAAVSLVQPENTFASPQPDTLRQFLGGMLFLAYIPVTLLSACVTAMLMFSKGEASRSAPRASKAKLPMRPHQPESVLHNWRGLVYGLITLGGVFAFTCVLSPVWNYSSTSYFPSTSPYSLLPASVIWLIDTPAGQGTIIPKVYADTIVYFSVVGSWVVLGAVATYVTGLRRILHARLVTPGLPAKYSLYPHGTTVGEAFLLSSFIGLTCYWFWFWSTGYPRIMEEPVKEGDAYVQLHGYARVMGHMTTLFMSFLTFPIARNSVWESAFGVPFDRAVKYHRTLGRLVWTAVTIHALLWWIKWKFEGTLLANVLTFNNLVITMPPGGQINCPGYPSGNCVHADNFTIPLVEFSWLLLTVALVIAGLFRRSNYELFQYTHVAALLFMITALIHAWSHWYYTAAGLLLLAFDKVSRTIKAARPVSVVSLSHAAGVTRLVLDRKAMGQAGHYAGQYAWLNIPGLGPFQWHPFTISSSPAAARASGCVEFHIKNMGAGTWTGQLAAVALAWQEKKGQEVDGTADKLNPADLCVSVDGPYGRFGRYYEASLLILVAGGIGVTPMHAVLQDLLLRARAAADAGLPMNDSNRPLSYPLGRLRRVVLVWSMRDAALAEEFAPTLLALHEIGTQVPELAGLFDLHLHLTEGSGDQAEEAAGRLLGKNATIPTPVEAGWTTPESAKAIRSLLQPGRPNMDRIFRDASAARTKASSGMFAQHEALASVCGPEPLIASVSSLSSKFNMSFHSEVFHF